MPQSRLTTPLALRRTIETDVQVYRWFYLLITRKDNRDELIKVDENEKAYGKLKAYEFCQWLFLILALGLLLVTYLLSLWILAVIALVCFVLAKRFALRARKAAAEIGLSLIQKELDPPILEKMTLYQIGEHLAKTYQVRPMLDVLTGLNGLIRLIVVLTFVTITVIYPLNFWQTWAAVLAAFLLIDVINNSPPVYRNVK